MKVVDAAILVADLEGSSEFANHASLEDYNRLVREYHWRGYEAVQRYIEQSKLSLVNLERAARGTKWCSLCTASRERRTRCMP
jgi:class 3 adenylate cyclase